MCSPLPEDNLVQVEGILNDAGGSTLLQPTTRNYLCSLLPEDNLVQVEGILDDAGGGHPGPEDVLLGGHVVRLRHPVNVRQKARKK